MSYNTSPYRTDVSPNRGDVYDGTTYGRYTERSSIRSQARLDDLLNSSRAYLSPNRSRDNVSGGYASNSQYISAYEDGYRHRDNEQGGTSSPYRSSGHNSSTLRIDRESPGYRNANSTVFDYQRPISETHDNAAHSSSISGSPRAADRGDLHRGQLTSDRERYSGHQDYGLNSRYSEGSRLRSPAAPSSIDLLHGRLGDIQTRLTSSSYQSPQRDAAYNRPHMRSENRMEGGGNVYGSSQDIFTAADRSKEELVSFITRKLNEKDREIRRLGEENEALKSRQPARLGDVEALYSRVTGASRTPPERDDPLVKARQLEAELAARAGTSGAEDDRLRQQMQSLRVGHRADNESDKEELRRLRSVCSALHALLERALSILEAWERTERFADLEAQLAAAQRHADDILKLKAELDNYKSANSEWEAHCTSLEKELSELRHDRTEREIMDNRRLDEQMRINSALVQCLKDLRGLVGLCSVRLNGEDPSMSLILGVPSNAHDDQVLERLLNGDVTAQLDAAQAVLVDVKKLKDMANDAFISEDREFEHCIQQ